MKLDITLHEKSTKKQISAITSKKDHLLLTGVAGTGKTSIAVARALRMIASKRVDKIVIIRSPVAVRDIGFLPGDQDEKVAAFAAPYHGLFHNLCPKYTLTFLMSKGIVDVIPTSFLRGQTFEDCAVIIDEYQNFSGHELTTAVTRLGNNSYMIFCGDTDQTDLKGREAHEHARIIETLEGMEDDVDTFHFGIDDVVRSGFVGRFLRADQERKQDSLRGRTPEFLRTQP